ncbi:hypothetical protein BJ875DRAFT_363172, partial [Amylocarpus encephaloides]
GPDGQPMYLMPALAPKKPKRQAPQGTIDEFWAKFDSKTPGKASTILPKNTYAKKASEKASKKPSKGESAVSSYEEAARICKEKVEKIVKECKRVNQKYVDKHFDIEFDLKWEQYDTLATLTDSPETAGPQCQPLPGSVKRVGDIFEKPEFFSDGATASDIRQGRDGDCWFLAALCTLGNTPGLIEKVCVARNEMVGVYGFVFHRDGEWISEIIDDKLFLIKPDYDESWFERSLIDEHSRVDSQEEYRKLYQTNSSALYFAQCEDPNETWLPLLEKAYAKAHGDFAAISGGLTGEGLEDLTGGVTTELFAPDILDKDYFWTEELMKVNQSFLFGCASFMFLGGRSYSRGARKGVLEGHAYSIMKCKEIDGKRLCLLRNTWGKGEWTGPWSDGSKEWTPEWMQKLDHRFGDDGQFWMTYDDLLKTYQSFDRTRLFSDEWKVTQKWTSMTVPWLVDYNDTKFCFTLDKTAPVVVVLSQLDDRYFVGLKGQYRFKLAFRVHRAGEEDYVVRNHSNYCANRSVTTELELEAGEYHVLVKVEANRNPGVAHVEDVLRNNVRHRRDKLLRIGLAYDMAHAKGEIIETEQEKEGKKKAEETKRAKEMKAMKDKLFKEKQKRKHYENHHLRKEQAAELKRREKRSSKMAMKAEAKMAKAAEKEAAKSGAKAEGGSDIVKGESAEQYTPVNDDESVKAEVKEDESPTIVEEDALVTTTVEPTESEPAETETTDTLVTTDESTPEIQKSSEEADAVSEPLAEKPEKEEEEEQDEEQDELDSRFDLESITSTVSTISDMEVEDELEEAKLAAEAPILPPAVPLPEEEDEFENDPWNAVAVVGLRIYAKDARVTVKVERPLTWED